MKYSKFGKSDNSIGLLFWQVSTLWQRAIKDALREYDLTHTQYVILAVIQELSEIGTDTTQRKISDYSMIDTMTVSSTLRLLESKGLTQRIPHEHDSRANIICNTPQGVAVLKKAIQVVEDVDSNFFFKDDTDLRAFQKLLLNLKDNIQK